MENTDFEKITGLLTSSRNILITTHTNPDGDAIGASLALYGYFMKKGHSVSVMIPDPDPGFLHWMPYHETLLVFSQQETACAEAIGKAELIFSVDYNGLHRLSHAESLVRKSTARRILIDHHTLPSGDFDFKISVTEVSSTSELVYDFIVDSGDRELIDRNIAECIYAGIVTDTGSFSYSCNYVKTYLIVAELYKTGIDGEHIHRLVYDTYSESRLRLLGYSLGDKLTVLPEYHAAYIWLSREELERFNHRIGDTEGIVNYALSIEGINLAAIFYETDEYVKVSLRSKGNFPVNGIAREYFNGGGHNNAAGANSYVSMEETLRIFLDILPKYKEQLKKVY